jgi:hypothetical protein
MSKLACGFIAGTAESWVCMTVYQDTFADEIAARCPRPRELLLVVSPSPLARRQGL